MNQSLEVYGILPLLDIKDSVTYLPVQIEHRVLFDLDQENQQCRFCRHTRKEHMPECRVFIVMPPDSVAGEISFFCRCPTFVCEFQEVVA